jgi:TatD DNase family protein
MKPLLTDSHCHLAMFEGANEALVRARDEGIRGFLVPGTTLADSRQVVSLVQDHEDVWGAVGVHPHEAKDFDESTGRELRLLADDQKVVAIGEIGLDYHYDFSPREVQRNVLIEQLQLAKELDLPVIIHNRESTDDLVAVLEREELRGLRGVLHSFTESYEVARRVLELGYYISFSGIVTFRSADALRDVASRLPHDRVLIETDTPYLAPVPHRGRRNEPAYVSAVAALLAGLWNVDVNIAAGVTTSNFEQLFRVSVPR